MSAVESYHEFLRVGAQLSALVRHRGKELSQA